MNAPWPQTPIPQAVSDRITDLIAAAQLARQNADWAAAWASLEDAHVLSQPWVRPHLNVHAAMLGVGWHQRDVREVFGQLTRLVMAGPGTASGRFPVGNTGRARVSAFKPMPVRPDLNELLKTRR